LELGNKRNIIKLLYKLTIYNRASHLVDIAYLDLKKATLLLNNLRKVQAHKAEKI
jgi:hypothetical protein